MNNPHWAFYLQRKELRYRSILSSFRLPWCTPFQTHIKFDTFRRPHSPAEKKTRETIAEIQMVSTTYTITNHQLTIKTGTGS